MVLTYAKNLILILGLVIGAKISVAQVSNDSIENRLELTLNQWHSSRTDDCTVQWNCVNEVLTGKCIEYHNDQWFTFQVPNTGSYYMNIARQACRDVRGVQLVVIDGIPCQTATYKILACVSLASQDDIYVQLDSLQPGREYLLNVDGYLHDYCRFEIQGSGQPKGFPMNQAERSTTEAHLEQNILTLSWKADEETAAQVQTFRVFRRSQQESSFALLKMIPLEKNAFGAFRESYSVRDTLLKTGTWFYKITGTAPDGKILLIGEYQQVVTPRNLTSNYLTLPLPYRKKTSVTILIYEAENKTLLEKMAVTVKETNQELRYFAGYLLEKGVRTVLVKTIDNKTGQTRESVIPLLVENQE